MVYSLEVVDSPFGLSLSLPLEMEGVWQALAFLGKVSLIMVLTQHLPGAADFQFIYGSPNRMVSNLLTTFLSLSASSYCVPPSFHLLSPSSLLVAIVLNLID